MGSMKWSEDQLNEYLTKKSARLMADRNPVRPVEFRAPYPLSLNKMYRNVKGRTLISREGRQFKEQVMYLAKAAGVGDPFSGWVSVEILLHPVEPGDAKKRAEKQGEHWHLSCRCIDADNALKPALDAMQGIVYMNDSQIASLLVQRGIPVPEGGMTIRVTEILKEAA